MTQNRSKDIIRLWRDLIKERQMEEAQKLSEKIKELEQRKTDLLERRKLIAKWMESCRTAKRYLENDQIQAAVEILKKIIQEKKLEPLKNSQEIAVILFYLYKGEKKVAKMLEVADAAIAGLAINKKNYSLFYDVANLHRESGDPAISQKIFCRIKGIHI